MKKITRREMLKSISVGLVGTMFCVPSVLNAVDQGEAVNEDPVLIRVLYDLASGKRSIVANESLHCHGHTTSSNSKGWDWVIPAPKRGWKILPSSLKITKREDGHCLAGEVSQPVFREDGSVLIHLYVKARRRHGATLLVEVKYDIVTEGVSNWNADTVEFSGDPVKLQLPSDLPYESYDENDKNQIKINSVQAVYSSGKKENIVFPKDDDYVIQKGLLVKLNQKEKTVSVRIPDQEENPVLSQILYNIASKNLKTDSVEFSGDSVELPLPSNNNQIKINSVQIIYSNGKKENIDFPNADDGYVIQKGFLIKLNQKEKTVTVRILEEK